MTSIQGYPRMLAGALAALLLGFTAGAVQADDRAPRDEPKGKLGLPRELHRASDVIGKKVENEQGESLGKIEDIVIDEPEGRIVYAVLSFGGILGIGDKLFAIPWQALRDNPGKKSCLLSVDKEKLKKAPGFNKNDWPDMANPEWGRGIHTFYGVAGVEEGRHGRSTLDFGDAELKRESTKLPLSLKQGQTYRYVVDMHPESGTTEGARESAERTPGAGKDEPFPRNVEMSFKVINVEADKTTLESTCRALSAVKSSEARTRESDVALGEPRRFQVMKDGQVVCPDEKAAGGDDKLRESVKAHVKAQLEHIFGYRLHDQTFEPGKEYSMPGSVHDLLGHGTAAAGGEHRMRYEGVTRIDRNKVARFTILSGASRAVAGERERRESADGESEAAQVAYRMDDGLLERLAMGSTTIRRISNEADVGN